MFVTQIFDECAEILGTTDKSKVFRKISQAVQTLMESGHWTHSTAEVDVCTGWDECSIALPRGVSVPLAVNVDGSPVYFRNRLFQYHVNAGGKYNPVEWAWDDRGYVATLMEIIQPSELVAVAESSNDVGKTIRVVGTDNLNRQIRSQLPDGTGVDGLLVPINSISDFAFGVITPSGANVATREVAVTPIQNFKSATPHQLNSGERMSVTALPPGLIPVPLSDGQTYYIGVVDALTIKLFNDSLNAQSGDYPISLQSIIGAGQLEFLDERASQVVTALRFATAPTIGIDAANPIFFPPGQQLPAPLKTETTYFGNLLDATNLQIFETEENAQNNYGEVYTTGSISPINVDIRKQIAPETKLNFVVPHLFLDGDQVQAFTSGGVLPRPLITNKNYFVNVIDSTNVTLHENQADANSSTGTFFVNPIILITPGSGVVSLVKLIPATASVGDANQITATGLNIPVPGGIDAEFQAVRTGSVTSVRVTAGGSLYENDPDVTFSDPPDPPTGQIKKTAVGYAVRNTIDKTIREIIITEPGSGYVTAPTVTIDPAVGPAFSVSSITSNAATLITTVTTAVPHGFVSTDQVVIAGVTSPLDYNGTKTVSTVSTNTFTFLMTSFVINSIITNEVTPGLFVATVTTANAHGFNNSDNVLIAGATGYNGVATPIVITPNSFNFYVSSLLPSVSTGTVVKVLGNAVGTNMNVKKAITGSQATAVATFTTTFVSRFTKVSGGSGYTEAPQVTIEGGGGAGATAKANIANGEVASIDIITLGSGYTSQPAVIIQPSTGVFVEFQSTGALPQPLAAGTAYRAENPTTGNVFTIKNTDYSKVDIKSSGSGTLYVVLSRSFGVAFTGNWRGDFGSLGQIQGFYFGTDFLLPTTSPAIDNGVTQFWLRKDTNESGRVYISEYAAQISDDAEIANGGNVFAINSITTSEISPGVFQATVTTQNEHGYGDGDKVQISGANVSGYNGTWTIEAGFYASDAKEFYFFVTSLLPASTSGSAIRVFDHELVTATSLGTGQAYYGIRFNVIPSVYDNLIEPDNIQFIGNDEIVEFSSSGTLPSPLIAGQQYTVKLFGNRVKAYSNGNLVNLSTPGSGRLTLDIRRIMNVSPSTSIHAPSCLNETGASVTVRASEDDVLPNGLIAGITYFVRKIASDTFELYDTITNAENLVSTTGRREFLTTGNKTTSKFFVDSVQGPVLVKTVAHIEKPKTDGYVSLYAWDYGRSNDLTLIGQYHPDEINPQYRRIRIGKRCAWARIAYRLTPPTVTSIYDYIPLEHERAIITAVHACDLEDKDFADQATRYWGIAFQYLKSQQEHIDGHAFSPPQIQNLVYADTGEPIMT